MGAALSTDGMESGDDEAEGRTGWTNAGPLRTDVSEREARRSDEEVRVQGTGEEEKDSSPREWRNVGAAFEREWWTES